MGFPVLEIRKNHDLRKILVSPKIFLKSRFHCTISISQEIFKFSIMLISYKFLGKKSREIVDLLSRLSLQNDFVPIVSEKLKTNNGEAKWFYYFLSETASALC